MHLLNEKILCIETIDYDFSFIEVVVISAIFIFMIFGGSMFNTVWARAEDCWHKIFS